MIRNNPQLRFAMPVIWENIATTAIGLVQLAFSKKIIRVSSAES